MSCAIFERYHGSEEEVNVFMTEDGEEITAIAAKAFLSCKTIKKLSVGSAVAGIGDWAFAHMQNLEQLTLPRREIMFGKKVFLDCERLRQIRIAEDNSNNPGTAYLLASAVRVLKKEGLCKPHLVGDKVGHPEWIKEYDTELLSFLQSPDEEGFDPVFFGWFKVDDIDDQIPGFLAQKRKEKARLSLQRLAYPMYLQEKTKEKLYDYIREHVPSGENKKEHVAVYELFCEDESEYAGEVKYYQILRESGCLKEHLISKLLENRKDESAEVTAYLLRQQFSKEHEKDYFSGFNFEI